MLGKSWEFDSNVKSRDASLCVIYRHTSRHPQFRTPTRVSSHGWTYQGGAMQAWTTGYVLPKQLVDILYSTVEDTEDSEGEDDSDVDDNDSGDKKK